MRNRTYDQVAGGGGSKIPKEGAGGRVGGQGFSTGQRGGERKREKEEKKKKKMEKKYRKYYSIGPTARGGRLSALSLLYSLRVRRQSVTNPTLNQTTRRFYRGLWYR